MLATFANQTDSYVHKGTNLPDNLLLQVGGDEIMSDIGDRVVAVVNFYIVRDRINIKKDFKTTI